MNADEIRTALADPEAEVRRQAVSTFASLPEAEIREMALSVLGDSDWRVRKEAARVLGPIAERVGLVPKLVEALVQGDNVGLRSAALEVIDLLGERATPELLDALDRVPANGVKFIVQALGDVGPSSVVPRLSALAASEDANVAAAAIDALTHVGGQAATDALVQRLSDPDTYRVMAAIDGLAQLEATVPWEQLEPLVNDRLVRRVALPLIGRCNDPRGVLLLIEALAERAPHTVSAAVVALDHLAASNAEAEAVLYSHLRELGDPVLDVLCNFSAGEDAPASAAASRLLLAIHHPAALKGIIGLALGDGLTPRTVRILSDWGTGAVRPMLHLHGELLGAQKAMALELGCDLLGSERGTNEAADAELSDILRNTLRTALDDPDGAVRLAAARCMAQWATAGDAPRLISLASVSDERLSRAAGKALECLGKREPEAVRSALSAVVLEGPGSATLTHAVAQMLGKDGLERLQAALSADDPGTRMSAIDGLAGVDGARAVDQIGLALADESIEVQVAAAEALGHMQDPTGRPVAVDQLLLALESSSPAVRAAAARGLGSAGDERASQALRALLREGAPGVALAAMEGLRALRDPSLDELLIEAMGHEDQEVVKQALLAVREIQGPRTVAVLAVGLEHGAWDVRRLAAEQLGQVVDQDGAIDALNSRLDHEEDDLVRQAILEALGAGDGAR